MSENIIEKIKTKTSELSSGLVSIVFVLYLLTILVQAVLTVFKENLMVDMNLHIAIYVIYIAIAGCGFWANKKISNTMKSINIGELEDQIKKIE